jgi:hypothetical protein
MLIGFLKKDHQTSEQFGMIDLSIKNYYEKEKYTEVIKT